jgi:hypothetical protein
MFIVLSSPSPPVFQYMSSADFLKTLVMAMKHKGSDLNAKTETSIYAKSAAHH